MTHLKKYWLWYLIAIIVVVVAILAYSNWETVKGWFPASGTGRTQGPGSGAKQIGCIGVTKNLITGEINPNSGHVTVNGIISSQRCPNEIFGL